MPTNSRSQARSGGPNQARSLAVRVCFAAPADLLARADGLRCNSVGTSVRFRSGGGNTPSGRQNARARWWVHRPSVGKRPNACERRYRKPRGKGGHTDGNPAHLKQAGSRFESGLGHQSTQAAWTVTRLGQKSGAVRPGTEPVQFRPWVRKGPEIQNRKAGDIPLLGNMNFALPQGKGPALGTSPHHVGEGAWPGSLGALPGFN